MAVGDVTILHADPMLMSIQVMQSDFTLNGPFSGHVAKKVAVFGVRRAF
jgi:hypothetical protein